MIQSNLQIAFGVEVLHSYFGQNICKCLQFKPGEVTRELMERFDINIRNKSNGFDLFINTRNSLPAYLQYVTTVTAQTFFDFGISLSDPNFYLFTDLPVNWMGQLLYDTHTGSNAYADGWVQLSQSLSENSGISAVGNLTVHFDDITKFSADNNYAKFQINYIARATQRQYFVINKNSIQLDDPAITGKANIDFNAPEDVTIENGQQALLFSSGNNLIPLSEAPGYKFDLVNRPAVNGNDPPKKAAAPKIIFKGLPDPDPARIGIVEVEGKKQVSSPIYVYV